MFYCSELAALGGLLEHVLVYSALRLLIAREEEPGLTPLFLLYEVIREPERFRVVRGASLRSVK